MGRGSRSSERGRGGSWGKRAEAGRELKEAVNEGFATLNKVFSKNSVDPIAQPLVARSPERIAMILEAENKYMRTIHEPGF